MAQKKTAPKTGSTVGGGLLAVAAAGMAAGYYFYASKNAKKHRDAAATWALGLKKDVLREAKKLKKVDKQTMMKAVDQAAQTYARMRDMNKDELARATRELKANWQKIAQEVNVQKPAVKKTIARVRRAVKKAVQ